MEWRELTIDEVIALPDAELNQVHVRVTDRLLIREFMSATEAKYERLLDIAADVGALIVPLPELLKAMDQVK